MTPYTKSGLMIEFCGNSDGSCCLSTHPLRLFFSLSSLSFRILRCASPSISLFCSTRPEPLFYGPSLRKSFDIRAYRASRIFLDKLLSIEFLSSARKHPCRQKLLMCTLPEKLIQARRKIYFHRESEKRNVMRNPRNKPITLLSIYVYFIMLNKLYGRMRLQFP